MLIANNVGAKVNRGIYYIGLQSCENTSGSVSCSGVSDDRRIMIEDHILRFKILGGIPDMEFKHSIWQQATSY